MHQQLPTLAQHHLGRLRSELSSVAAFLSRPPLNGIRRALVTPAAALRPPEDAFSLAVGRLTELERALSSTACRDAGTRARVAETRVLLQEAASAVCAPTAPYQVGDFSNVVVYLRAAAAKLTMVLHAEGSDVAASLSLCLADLADTTTAVHRFVRSSNEGRVGEGPWW